jgi:ABC-type transport system involved in multi-copper enzyme maturation permease subunit
MIRQVLSELRKLFTIRSTYVFLAISLAIVVFFAFYIEAIRLTGDVTNPGKLASEVTSAVSALAVLISLVGVLLVTHEYRYNTIMYTLTSSNNRLKVLLAKVIVVSIFAVLATLFFGVLSPLLTYLGIQIKGLDMVAQNLPVWDLLWRSAFHGWAYAMLALVFAFIIRNQVGAIIVLLFLPGTVEALLGLLLKHNVAYLPFTALNAVLNNPIPTANLSRGESALVVLGYVVIGLVVSAVLFKKRDAN